jgi:hypothetical protein
MHDTVRKNYTPAPVEEKCHIKNCLFYSDDAEQNCAGESGGEPAIATCKKRTQAPAIAPVGSQNDKSHPVLFADDFLSTAMQKLDFLLERGSKCVAIILENRYGNQQKIDQWGKVVIVDDQPAPKVTDDADAIICYGCMTSELNCPYGYVLRTAQQGCEHKTPKQPTPKVTDVGAFEQSLLDTVSQACDEAGRSRHQTIPDFIRALAQRAREGYTTWQIIMYLESKIVKSFDGSWNPRNEYLREAINHIHNPQGGIKAVTDRNRKEG